MPAQPWKVSLHGGHSSEFCEHAKDPLRAVLEAAATAGYHTFGVSEHAPRSEERFLYTSEREKGYDLPRLTREFEAYAAAVRGLAREFEGRLDVLCGFEAEVIPTATYRDEMLRHRQHHGFDYMVGSVHYVDEISIDGPRPQFESALAGRGSLEALAIAYYQAVGVMVEALRPEVVGHFDLIRLNAGPEARLDTPPIRRAAERALEAVRDCEAILDVNTAGYRKGLGTPYPAPWLVETAQAMGIGFCFGDDSHGTAQVGQGIDEARRYLLENGVGHLTVLTRENGAITRKRVPLPADSR
jgi:histidinol-phosphatase (PHP family)